jgi:hypothetical protein
MAVKTRKQQEKEIAEAKRILGQENTQMMLVVAWQENDTERRNIDFGRVTMHVGDLLDPPLTSQEMQEIAFATKMAFAKVCRNRKKKQVK